MLSSITVEAVKNLDIVDVFLKCKIDIIRKGANWQCKSPFTAEKTPSFVVSPSKNMWKCFSTGKGGSGGVSFVMQYQKIEWIEAIKTLADMFHIAVEYDDSPRARNYVVKQQKIADIANINAQALLYFTAQENFDKLEKRFLRATPEQIETFNLGFAPNEWNGLKQFLIKLGYTENQMLDAGLIKQGEKGTYDIFRGRVMFPIYSPSGKINGFSGRISVDVDPDSKVAKVLNSKDTEAFKKGENLLGIYQSKDAIIKNNKCIVVEGNYDITAMYRAGFLNTVATLGTAFTDEHCAMIGKYTKNICFFIDHDAAGFKSIEPHVKLALHNGMHVHLMIPEIEGDDPYDWVQGFERFNSTEIYPGELKDAFDKQEWDAVEWLIYSYFDGVDPENTIQSAKAEQRITELLSTVSDATLRNKYIKKFATKFALNKALIEKEISITKAQQVSDSDGNQFQIPKHLKNEDDIQDYKDFGFYPDYNEKLGYWFQGQHGVERVTNWLIRPLFMVKDSRDSMRYIELTTQTRGKIVVDIPNAKINSPQAFETCISNKGGYYFHGTTKQYQKLKSKFLLQFPICEEIKTLGWFYEGFFSFANGIIENGTFKKVDEHGIVRFGQQEFFLPSFSTVHREARADNDVYEVDRRFIYRGGAVGFEKWAYQFHKVYKEKGNGMFGILYLCAVLFSDYIYSMNSDSFPILFGHGQPSTGKSTFGKSLASVFRSETTPFNLHSGTVNGFQRVLSRSRNVIEHLDEYRNDIEEKRFQGLKGIFDRTGSIKAVMSMDNRTVETKINACAYISGQHFCSRDGNSLATRSITIEFGKVKEKFTNEEVQAYDDLVKWQDKGLSDVIVEIVQYRSLIEAEYSKANLKISNEYREELGVSRVASNYLVLLTIYDVLKDRIKFPFSMQELMTATKKNILEQTIVLENSNELAEFFDSLVFLALDGRIHNMVDYKLDSGKNEIKVGRDGHSKQLNNANILYIRLARIYPLYRKAVRDVGNQGLDQQTIISYFKNHKAFIGDVKSTRFNDGSTSAFAFDYDLLDINLNGLSSDPITKKEKTATSKKSEKDSASIEDAQNFIKTHENGWPDEFKKEDEDLPF
jgi:DNA primase catalytic core